MESLPSDLNATYERILQRVNDSNPYSKMIVQRTLNWILYSEEDLSSKQLCQVISVGADHEKLDEESIPSEEEVLRCCSSLIRKANGVFELAHFTVKEFLNNLDKSKSPHLAAFCLDDDNSTLLLA